MIGAECTRLCVATSTFHRVGGIGGKHCELPTFGSTLSNLSDASCQMRLDGLTLLVRSGVGARDTGSARASSFAGRSVGPHPVSRRRANNMGAVNEALKALLLEAGQSKVRG